MTTKLGIADKVRAALARGSYDAVVLAGADNVQYLTGVQLPFQMYNPDRFTLVLWPRVGNPCVIAHADWTGALRDGAISDVISYGGDTPAAASTLALRLAAAFRAGGLSGGSPTIGLDLNRMPAHLYDEIRLALPQAELVDAGPWIRDLRMVKTPAEVELLAEAAYRTDHGICGACHHIMAHVSRFEKGAAEIIRVHCLERHMNYIGYDAVAEVGSGVHAQKLWPLAPKYGVGWGKSLAFGEYVRMAMPSSLDGYRSDACRLLTMGRPNEAQAEAYAHLVALRDAALAVIKPGTPCCDVYAAVKSAAGGRGAPWLGEGGVGHGIGVTSYEAPFLNASDRTPLQANMVLVLDLTVRGPEGELLRNKDTVVVTERGAEIVGWYKDWREPFIASEAYPSGGG